MSRILGLATTMLLMDHLANGVNVPKPEPVVPVDLENKNKRVIEMKRSDYYAAFPKQKPEKTYDEMTATDLARMIAADEKRQRKLARRAK